MSRKTGLIETLADSTGIAVKNLYSKDQMIDIVDKLKNDIKEMEKEIKGTYPYISRLNLKLVQDGKERLDNTVRLHMDPEIKLAHVKIVNENLEQDFARSRNEEKVLKARLVEIEKDVAGLVTANGQLSETIKERSLSDAVSLRSKLSKVKLKEQRLKTKLDELLESPFFKETEGLKTKMHEMKSTEHSLESLLKDIENAKVEKEHRLTDIQKLESQEALLDEAILSLNKKIAE